MPKSEGESDSSPDMMKVKGSGTLRPNGTIDKEDSGTLAPNLEGLRAFKQLCHEEIEYRNCMQEQKQHARQLTAFERQTNYPFELVTDSRKLFDFLQ